MYSEENVTMFSALRVSIYLDASERRARVVQFAPKNCKGRMTKAHPLADQVWYLYEFSSVEDRLDWELSLPCDVYSWLCPEIIPSALEYYC